MSLYGVGETYHFGFDTYNASGVLTNADSLPTGVLSVNGSDSGATVTITNAATGRYQIAASLAARSVGDDCHVRFSATVGGVTQEQRTPPFRVAFPAALSGGMLTAGTGTAQLNVTSGAGDANVVKVAGSAALPYTGVAQGGTTTTIIFANGETNWPVGREVVANGYAGRCNAVSGWGGATPTGTIDGTWPNGYTPQAGDKYSINDIKASVDTNGRVQVQVGTSPGQINSSGGKVPATMGSGDYSGNTPQTGDAFALIGTAGAGLTALAPASTALSTANYTAARAGYLDNLNVGGNVASHADATSLATAIGTPAQASALSSLVTAVGTPMQASSYSAPPSAATIAALVLTTAVGAPSAGALDSVADNAITLQHVAWAVMGMIGTNDVSGGSNEVFKTPAGTTIRTAAITTSGTNPFGSNFAVKRG